MRRALVATAVCVWALAACDDNGTGKGGDLAVDAGGDTVTATDTGVGDAGEGDTALLPDASPDAFVPPDVGPDATLVIEQIGLSGMMGEAALVVGPGGTSVLIDVGGDSHAAQVLEAVDRRLGQRVVDWVVITHYHFDHIGAFDKLFVPCAANNNKPITVAHGVVIRGIYDLESEQIDTTADLKQLCQELSKPAWQGKVIEICSGPAAAPCDGSTAGAPWAASGCPGLLLGNLADPADDTQGALSRIELGGGARLVLYHANGFLAAKNGIVSAASAGISIGHGGTFPENGRSLGGVIRWGSFLYTFHGDLTGQLEAWVVAAAAEIVDLPGSQPLVPTGGLDVAHLSHHGFATSTSQVWVDWLLPADGESRNAMIGATSSYVLPPEPAMLNRVGPRVGSGSMWVTEPGLLGGKHAALKVAAGAVVVQVASGGSDYQVFPHTSAGDGPAESFVSTTP
jgi:hypothetical protein